MKITKEWMYRNFAVLNHEYFNDELPMPFIMLNRAKGSYGCFKHYCPIVHNGKVLETAKEVGARNGYPYGKLLMSTSHERPEKDHLGTLLHEMIHEWQYWNGGRADHGVSFRSMASKVNRDGWDIQRVEGRPTEACYARYTLRRAADNLMNILCR